jgi:hypothetical protein
VSQRHAARLPRLSRSTRILVLVGTLVVLVIAFVALRPGHDDGPTAATATAPPASTSTTAAPPPAAPTPTYTRIVVRERKPLGGVQRIKVRKGEQVRIVVSSPDTSDEIHLHGYDLKRALEAGGSVRFSFRATADGIYEIELERARVKLAELVVAT